MRIAAALVLILAGCRAVQVSEPPAGLALDPFYAKYVDARGIPVIASARVPDAALLAAAAQVTRMLARREDLAAALARGGVRLAVMSPAEKTTDLPEHAHLEPKAFWDARARGLGGTPKVPTTSCAEENLLGYADDPYDGENILVHEFAHTIHEVGLAAVEPSFDGRLALAFDAARAAGLWEASYAATDAKEYWAEGVQAYFDANRRAIPPDGIHNHVRTREGLQAYDPRLFALVDGVFRGNPWRWRPVGVHRARWGAESDPADFE